MLLLFVVLCVCVRVCVCVSSPDVSSCIYFRWTNRFDDPRPHALRCPAAFFPRGVIAEICRACDVAAKEALNVYVAGQVAEQDRLDMVRRVDRNADGCEDVSCDADQPILLID